MSGFKQTCWNYTHGYACITKPCPFDHPHTDHPRSSGRPRKAKKRLKTVKPFSLLKKAEKYNLLATALRNQPTGSELYQYSKLSEEEMFDALNCRDKSLEQFYCKFATAYNHEHTDHSSDVDAILAGAATHSKQPSAIPQVPPPQIVSALPPPNVAEAPPPLMQLIPPVHKEMRISWIDNDAYVGNMFINKIKLDAERVWIPEGISMTDTRTQIKSFEELVSVSALDSALIMTDSTFEDIFADGFISHFPPEVDLTIIADTAENEANKRRSNINRATKRIFICKDCSPCGWLEQEQPGCPTCYAITFLLFPSSQLHPNLILLRYNHCLRVIITSASLRRRHWEEVVQIGWTADFPFFGSNETSWVAMMDEEEARGMQEKPIFALELEAFLKDLQIGDHLLTGIDFSKLSPCVRLVTSKLGAVSQEETDSYAVSRLKALVKVFPWRDNSNRQSICVSHRLGLSNDGPLKIINDIFRVGDRLDSPFKLVYPSDADAKKHCSEVDNLSHADLATDDLFINFDSFFHSHPRLHSTQESLILHANALLKYEDVSVESGCKRLGWFMFGSQVLGYKSWGEKRYRRHNDVQILERMELGVGFFPHFEETAEEFIIHVLDLNTVPLPFDPNALERYRQEDFPFWPMTPDRPREECFSVCLGRFRKAINRHCGFLHPLDGPLTQYSDAYGDETAFLRPGLWNPDPPGSQFPQEGSIVRFVAYLVGERRFRTMLLLQTWPTYGDALCHYEGEEAAEIYAEEMPREAEQIREPPRTFESRMASLAIKTEEEFQEHLKVPLSVTTQYLQSKFLEPSQEAMEAAFPMQATRIPPDITFLERHVPEMCGGKVPPLLGPYSVPLLQRGLQYYNAAHFKALSA